MGNAPQWSEIPRGIVILWIGMIAFCALLGLVVLTEALGFGYGLMGLLPK